MSTECNARDFDFQGLGSRAVTARFDGGAITSDAGTFSRPALPGFIRFVRHVVEVGFF